MKVVFEADFFGDGVVAGGIETAAFDHEQ